MVATDVALRLGAVTVHHYIDNPLIMVQSQEIEAAAELLKACLQD